MKMFKKVFAVIMCVAMIASCMTMAASADEAKTVVDGIRWFPCEPGRENDAIWEVECVKEGCGCQRFTDVAEETGNANFLDTVYGEDGSLTITRNGNDQTEGNYWPRIRTLWLEAYPELDFNVANTLYFDLTAAEGTQWNVMLNINGMNIKVGKAMAEACGNAAGMENSDHDAPSGSFKGTINIPDTLAALATESTESGTYAKAIQNMSKTFVPQLQIFCVGPVGASVTINEMFISTAEDTTGANCDYLDMGLVFGDEIYDIDDTEGGNTEGDVEGDPEGDVEGDAAEGDTAATTTTTKAAAKDEGGSNTGLIIGIIVAVVVIGAVVVVVVMKKKK